MDLRSLLLAFVAITCVAVCTADDTKLDKRTANNEVVDEGMDALADDADKRVFRYGRSPGVFRYGKRDPGVFRYGKRDPGLFRYGKRDSSVFRYGKRDPGVFRYGKREFDGNMDDNTMKRLFRWGKRDNDDIKRLFRWGKRSDDMAEDDDVKRMVFRYGKRYDDSEMDDMDEVKRKVFQFGKRNTDDEEVNDLDIRSDSPHVPFRFGDEE